MRRVTTTLVLALSLIGCGPSGEPVALSIYEGPLVPGNCSDLAGWYAAFVADQTYGTAVGSETKAWPDPDAPGAAPGHETWAWGGFKVGGPIWWPKGYTARRDGSEVVVYGSDGKEVARTGQRYRVWPPADVAPIAHRIVACDVTPL